MLRQPGFTRQDKYVLDCVQIDPNIFIFVLEMMLCEGMMAHWRLQIN